MSCVSHSSYPSLLVVKSCLSILSRKYPNNLLGFLLPKNHAQVGLLQTLGTNRPTKSATKLLMLNTWTLRFLIAGFTPETDILDYLYCSFQQIPVWNHPSVYTLLQNAVDIPITNFPIFWWFNTPIFLVRILSQAEMVCSFCTALATSRSPSASRSPRGHGSLITTSNDKTGFFFGFWHVLGLGCPMSPIWQQDFWGDQLRRVCICLSSQTSELRGELEEIRWHRLGLGCAKKGPKSHWGCGKSGGFVISRWFI